MSSTEFGEFCGEYDSGNIGRAVRVAGTSLQEVASVVYRARIRELEGEKGDVVGVENRKKD